MGISLNIKILVATHKKYWMPDDSVYIPMQVGAELNGDLEYQKDNIGDNISIKNPYFCELTAIYWAWKNLDADYIGLVHYRRYFTRKNCFNVAKRRKYILTGDEWENILTSYPIVVPDKRKYYIETNQSHYNHAHPRESLDFTKKIIQEIYPEYFNAFLNVMDKTWAHMFNMFVMRHDYYEEYCTWLFTILFLLEKKIDISHYNKYQARVFGFISELLLDVWLEKKGLLYKEQNVSFLEKQNWLVKGGNFLKRKFGDSNGTFI